MPKDLLDLIPRPKCDNCGKFEAGVECAVCDEVFCHTCWESIHFGGRRKDHEFRVLYDYYGKRIDYGDGVFPCKWSTEVMQDEIQGWMLRVAPIRDAIAIYGDWEYYADDSGIIYNPSLNIDASKAFYFNRKSFETTYEMPIQVAEDIAQKEAEEIYAQAANNMPNDLEWTADTGYSEGYTDQWGETGTFSFDGSFNYDTQTPSSVPVDQPLEEFPQIADYSYNEREEYTNTYSYDPGVSSPVQRSEAAKTAGFNIRRRRAGVKHSETTDL